MIVLKDGGVLIIPDETINKWKLLYPNIDIKAFINELNQTGIFGRCSKKKALRVINSRLKEENKSRIN